jgi:HSP20 family protein
MTMLDLIPWKRSEKAPVRQTQTDSILRLRDEMNRLMDDFFEDPWSLRPSQAFDTTLTRFIPHLDLNESDKEIAVSVELPGLNEKDVQVTLQNQVLTISGEKKSESNDKGEGFFRSERSYGAFCRQLELPENVDEENVSAVFKNGVLNISVPKRQAEPVASKKILIKRG